MESKERTKWERLTGDQRSLLLAIVEIFQGKHLKFDEFAETMHSLLEDFPGMEILSHSKRINFVNELWREFEWRRKKEKLRNRPKSL